jgi:hypothetical protein
VLLRMLATLGLPLALVGGLMTMLLRGPAAILGAGRLRGKVQVEGDTGVTFADVAGADEAKADFLEVRRGGSVGCWQGAGRVAGWWVPAGGVVWALPPFWFLEAGSWQPPSGCGWW